MAGKIPSRIIARVGLSVCLSSIFKQPPDSRRQSPVECEDYLSIHSSVHPPPANPEAQPARPGLSPNQPGLRTNQPGLSPCQLVQALGSARPSQARAEAQPASLESRTYLETQVEQGKETADYVMPLVNLFHVSCWDFF